MRLTLVFHFLAHGPALPLPVGVWRERWLFTSGPAPSAMLAKVLFSGQTCFLAVITAACLLEKPLPGRLSVAAGKRGQWLVARRLWLHRDDTS